MAIGASMAVKPRNGQRSEPQMQLAELGVRLLTRTTRRVSPTEAGERLFRTVAPRFEEVDAELEAVTALREKPAGTIRLNATENAADVVLWPALERFLPKYPDIKVEIVIDYGLTDLVAERFDADARYGEMVASGPRSRVGGLAPAFFRIPSLLPKPSPADPGFCLAARGAPLSRTEESAS